MQYGAHSGLSGNNAKAIQKAVDAAAKTGGTVLIPAGNFVTGPVMLKSGVELHLANDAALLGSTSRMDYQVSTSVISAVGQKNVAVTGNGLIDGRGAEVVQDVIMLLRKGVMTDPEWKIKRPTEHSRPNILLFLNCTNVRVSGITIKNSANWVQNYKDCDGVQINNIKVQSTCYWNNDGIDIVDSRNVIISNSYFNASDDGICLKSERADGVCENISVINCTARTSANGFKIGTGSMGAFKNIEVKNLTVYDTYRSAVALETVDGAAIEDVRISNVKATNTGNAIFIRLGHRNTDERYGSFKKVLISDVKVEVPAGKPDIGYPLEGPPPKVPPHNLLPASIVGIPGHPVTDVRLRNIEVSYEGGASKSKAHISLDSLSTVPENAAGYPEFSMFGELPAWGLYIRHAEDIDLQQITLVSKDGDFRPALVADDVSRLRVDELNVPASQAKPVVVLNKTTGHELTHINLPAGNSTGIIIQQ